MTTVMAAQGWIRKRCWQADGSIGRYRVARAAIIRQRFLKGVFPREGYDLIVEGRADGIMTEADGTVTVDEIKGVYRDIHQMEKPDKLHLAQAK